MRLARRSRAILAALGATFAVGAFASLPLYANSAGADGYAGRSIDRDEPVLAARDISFPFSNVNDPFARSFPGDGYAPTSHQVVVPRRAGTLRLRAIVAGKERLALVDDGSSRVVTTGDSIAGARVIAITVDSVRLSDGRVIRIDEASR